MAATSHRVARWWRAGRIRARCSDRFSIPRRCRERLPAAEAALGGHFAADADLDCAVIKLRDLCKRVQRRIREAVDRYFLAAASVALDSPQMQQVLDILRSAPFRADGGALAGYDPSESGSILSLANAFGPALQ
jgi:hypothetical protein